MEAVVPILLEHGLTGVIILALGWAYWQQKTELKMSQDSRVADAQKVAQMVLDLVDKEHEITSALARIETRLDR